MVGLLPRSGGLSIAGTPRELCQGPLSRGEYAPLPTNPPGFGAASQRYCVHRWLEGDFSIIPDERPLALERWDMVLIGALFTTAVLLPLDVSLLSCTSPAVNAVIDATDVVFLIDILLHFNIAYLLKDPGEKGEAYEARPIMIARRYMGVPCSQNMEAGWFWPDIVTLIPWDDTLETFEVHMATVRMIKLTRLLRILRLVRVVKLFRKWHTRVGMSMALLKIGICALTTIFLVHWLACLWAHLGQHPEYYGQRRQDSWLQNYIGPDVLVQDLSAYEMYYSALYFCVVVLTTVGFGDAVPINQVEIVVAILTIFLTGVTWAWVVGNIVNIITNLDAFGNTFNTVMDDLNSLMDSNGVDKSTRVRIRKHLHESYKVQKQKHAHASFAWLSEGLKGELAIQSGVGSTCNRIWYFKNLPRHVVVELADEFRANLFSPNETIITGDSASVIVRGSCMKNGRLLTRDACYGEDMILVSRHLRDTSCPVTLSFLEVMTIHREDMMDACDKYPEFNTRLRRAQIRLAVWRQFIYFAMKMRSASRAKSQGCSSWDTSFFNIGRNSVVDEDTKCKPPGWKESFSEDNKEADETNASQLRQSIGDILKAVESVQDTMVRSNLETQSCLQSFQGRFDVLEQEVAKVNAKVEAMGLDMVQQKDIEQPKSSFRSMVGRAVERRANSPKS